MKKDKEGLESMIDSCFTYGGYEKGSYQYKKYIEPYKDSFDSEEEFDKVYAERIKELTENYIIEQNVYTDGEGVTYNNLIRK
jgi:hypothetical protein